LAYSINTNISSLQAQEYLRQTGDFQSRTINRVTSGLRIVSSGDDAAGLAIANGYRSDQAVLQQGIRNANDGLSQLQIVDGGINNISKLLDRARTLATQSASGTFSGNRTVLNSEFQSVIGEIDRQAQSIGLDTGGSLAKALSVFVGGGKTSNGTTAIQNGSVSIDLSNSTVDARSLGLKGYQAVGAPGADIGPGAGNTTVQNIVANSSNLNSLATPGFAQFFFAGPGFSDSTGNNRIAVNVNLSGVSDITTLVASVNAALQNAGNGTSQQSVAFTNANLRASAVTDADGKRRLAFSSSSAAFTVQAGDRVANAFLGNFETSSAALGQSALAATPSSSTAVSGAAPGAADNDITLRVLKNGVATPVAVSLATTDVTEAAKLAKVQAGLVTAGLDDELTAALDGSNNLIFSSRQGGQTFEVQVANDENNYLGLGTFQGGFASTSVAAAAAPAAGSQIVEISVNGGVTISLGSLTATGTLATDIDTLNAAIQSNATLRAAGLIARDNGAGNIQFASLNGDAIRVNTIGGTDAFGFGITGATSRGAYRSDFAGTSGQILSAGGVANTAVGTNDDVFAFNGIRTSGVSQTVTVAASDASGALQSLSFSLTSANASTIDAALFFLNSQLQNSNNPTLQKVVAVKGVNAAGNGEGIRFVSSLDDFNVTLGTTSIGDSSLTEALGLLDATGIAGNRQGKLITSETAAGGSTVGIGEQGAAETAVAALAVAVELLGTAQAVVGRGQNQFNFAINLASSQLTNIAASESRIRDADLAFEAANLTKAQIGLQAGVAALAQANSAPQAILSLLQG
jgi:flagellin